MITIRPIAANNPIFNDFFNRLITNNTFYKVNNNVNEFLISTVLSIYGMLIMDINNLKIINTVLH